MPGKVWKRAGSSSVTCVTTTSSLVAAASRLASSTAFSENVDPSTASRMVPNIGCLLV